MTIADTHVSAIAKLEQTLRGYERAVIAFSGGADSAFLAVMAQRVLGSNALAVTAVSPSLAPEEEADCRALATELSLEWQPVFTNELADTTYAMNDSTRCARCKIALMDELGPIAQVRNATVMLGVNVDDLGDYRPGQQAAAEQGAVFPLVEAGFTKQMVREASRSIGLRTWDKPAAACLASRIPYGTPVTLGTLSRVAKAETVLKRLGFKSLRVRHYEQTARIEIGLDELGAVIENRQAIVDGVKNAGYEYVTLDLEGLRSGNLNGALQ